MKLVQKIAVAYLLFCAILTLGILIGHYKWFPFGLAEEVIDFVEYSLGEETSIVQKLENDLGGRPHRFIYNRKSLDTTGMEEMSVPALKERRAPPRLFLSEDAPKGFRALFGAFDFEETLWGALLIDDIGKVVNTWQLSTDSLPMSSEPDVRKNMYGADIFPDGSVIFLMQEAGGGIVRVDYCGDVIWTIDGKFHHTVTPTEDGGF